MRKESRLDMEIEMKKRMRKESRLDRGIEMKKE
jgi:hypothetical protein